MMGQFADALPLLERGLEHAQHVSPTIEVKVKTYPVEVYLLAGRHAEAGTCAANALELSRRRAERGVEARAHA